MAGLLGWVGYYYPKSDYKKSILRNGFYFMELQEIIDYCTAKKGVTSEFPFGEDVLVFKVMGKMFGLLMLNPPHSINLKCDPILAMALRQKYQGVRAGYHMNKKHWNTVELNADVPDKEIFSMIDDSYDLVVKGLTRAQQEKLV